MGGQGCRSFDFCFSLSLSLHVTEFLGLVRCACRLLAVLADPPPSPRHPTPYTLNSKPQDGTQQSDIPHFKQYCTQQQPISLRIALARHLRNNVAGRNVGFSSDKNVAYTSLPGRGSTKPMRNKVAGRIAETWGHRVNPMFDYCQLC